MMSRKKFIIIFNTWGGMCDAERMMSQQACQKKYCGMDSILSKNFRQDLQDYQERFFLSFRKKQRKFHPPMAEKSIIKPLKSNKIES